MYVISQYDSHSDYLGRIEAEALFISDLILVKDVYVLIIKRP